MASAARVRTTFPLVHPDLCCLERDSACVHNWLLDDPAAASIRNQAGPGSMNSTFTWQRMPERPGSITHCYSAVPSRPERWLIALVWANVHVVFMF